MIAESMAQDGDLDGTESMLMDTYISEDLIGNP